MGYNSIEELKGLLSPDALARNKTLFEGRGALPPIEDRAPILLTLPFPPSSNRYWRNYNGKMLKSEEARDYQADVKKACAGVRPLDGEVAVTLRFYRPRKSGDLFRKVN